ncbi:acyl-CoA thioesterase [Halomonas sp. M4R1S46]|uniref:acyl-CoA thioesterase n=1 Tax=Halomonas sp. M4R1S46 TaxID=2982692 RepID=UPI0021E3F5D7|nr:thioesterase family protein [Halomonas sp. M4R1S46]UYG08492.1 acyl-CoA thioesterase [Halomonas sp. M4R1S46]
MERVRLAFPEADIRHRHPLTVRVTDMNYGRHLGHDALVSLLHEARISALAALGLAEGDMGGYPSVAADLAVQYRAEARWPDALVVDTAIPAPSRKAITVYHRVRREADAAIVATARLNLMLVDPAGGRPVPIPGAVRDCLTGAA